jgi:hypothetical protein
MSRLSPAKRNRLTLLIVALVPLIAAACNAGPGGSGVPGY